MDGGAAVRAKSISIRRSGMRYRLIGAIDGYRVEGWAACAAFGGLRANATHETAAAIAATFDRFMGLSPWSKCREVLPVFARDACRRNADHTPEATSHMALVDEAGAQRDMVELRRA